jgi:hypothetical protein
MTSDLLLAFQHHHASNKCCRIVFDLFCLMAAGIMLKNIMHNGGTQFEIIVGLDLPHSHSFGDVFAILDLELTSEEIPEPIKCN